MDRTSFIKSVSEMLRANEIKKPVSIPKQIFHISDDSGNSKDFYVKQRDKSVIFTQNDVAAIVDACIKVIEDCLQRGEAVTFRGFGTLGLNYRKPRRTKLIGSEQEIEIEGRYTPKFYFGNELRRCAKLYELSLSDKPAEFEPKDEEELSDDVD